MTFFGLKWGQDLENQAAPPTSRSTPGHAATSGYKGMLSLADILDSVDYIR